MAASNPGRVVGMGSSTRTHSPSYYHPIEGCPFVHPEDCPFYGTAGPNHRHDANSFQDTVTRAQNKRPAPPQEPKPEPPAALAPAPTAPSVPRSPAAPRPPPKEAPKAEASIDLTQEVFKLREALENERRQRQELERRTAEVERALAEERRKGKVTVDHSECESRLATLRRACEDRLQNRTVEHENEIAAMRRAHSDAERLWDAERQKMQTETLSLRSQINTENDTRDIHDRILSDNLEQERKAFHTKQLELELVRYEVEAQRHQVNREQRALEADREAFEERRKAWDTAQDNFTTQSAELHALLADAEERRRQLEFERSALQLEKSTLERAREFDTAEVTALQNALHKPYGPIRDFTAFHSVTITLGDLVGVKKAFSRATRGAPVMTPFMLSEWLKEKGISGVTPAEIFAMIHDVDGNGKQAVQFWEFFGIQTFVLAGVTHFPLNEFVAFCSQPWHPKHVLPTPLLAHVQNHAHAAHVALHSKTEHATQARAPTMATVPVYPSGPAHMNFSGAVTHRSWSGPNANPHQFGERVENGKMLYTAQYQNQFQHPHSNIHPAHVSALPSLVPHHHTARAYSAW